MQHTLTVCPNCALGREVTREFWSALSVTDLGPLLVPFLLVVLASRHFRAPVSKGAAR